MGSDLMAPIGIVIQARMSSTRFPGKVLADFCGKPMLLVQIERLERIGLDLPVVVATSGNPADDAIESFCTTHSIEVFRGDEGNVFHRFASVARHFGFDHVVRLTGDNPLPQGRVLRACVKVHGRTGADLTSTREILPDRSLRRHVRKGCSVDVINAATLLSIDAAGLDAFQKEHVIPVFFEGGYRVEVVESVCGFDAPPIDLSVDTEQDLQKVAAHWKSVMERGAV